MITDFGFKAGDLETIRGILEKEDRLEQALIFGSRAKGNYKSGSDVDIALKGTGLTPEMVNHIAYQLNEETTMPYCFDVLDYHSIRETALAEHINRVGIVIYEKGGNKCDNVMI